MSPRQPGASRRRPRPPRGLGCLALALVLVVVATAAWFALRDTEVASPLPGQQRCVATASGRSVAVSLEQAHYAAVIVAVSVDRGLPARAASIALATAYQESGIRNLDHGDRDSVGLFQQRPSQGWGTVAQLRDPVSASERFYAALVRVEGWQTGDLNDVAQRVQRSGHPDAYRDHEADARTLASVLTGYSPAGLRCLERSGQPGRAAALAETVNGLFSAADARAGAQTVTVAADTLRHAWAYAHYAVADAGRYGVASVRVGDRVWSSDHRRLADWRVEDASAPPSPGRTGQQRPGRPDRLVTITVKG